MDPADLWTFLPKGYVETILIEGPILWLGLSRRHPWTTRLAATFWLTGCTYPIVILVLPLLLSERWLYLTVAETFAPAAECLLFWLAFDRPLPTEGPSDEKPKEPDTGPTGWELAQDMATIVVANLASFGLGVLLNNPGGK